MYNDLEELAARDAANVLQENSIGSALRPASIIVRMRTNAADR
ncbi:MAG TPA: hypothetical protein VFJ58_01360 [Armatimonadota bacterium]|nr:hypothetical protein [Armatimonadota bacterium]